MKNNLTTTQSTDLVLKKSKSMLNITNRILSGKTALTQIDDNWIQRLWDWADKNEIGDLEWVEYEYCADGGYYRGVPRDKKSLLALVKLNLIENQLTELPKEIGNLTNLKELWFSDNQLTELPKEIGNLSNLTLLTLNDNQLTELPKEIGNLSNLKELWLYRNQLTELPKEIGNLSNLTDLWLWDNQLKELPKEIGNLSNLTSILLWNNPNLILTQEQKEWIKELKENGCDVRIDDDLFDRNINYDEIPF